MTYEESPALEPDNLLPVNLNAKILYHLPSLSKTGQIQATCLFLHENKQYRGIVFSQDNESWLKDILPGAIVKVTDIRPCGYAKYAGQYMGKAYAVETAECINLAHNENVIPFVINGNNGTNGYSAYIADLLRLAASTIERILSEAYEQNKVEKVVVKTKTPIKLKYKRSDEWEVIIKKIVMESDSLRTKPFSGISLNAYIDATYKDWEEGDLEVLKNGSRWKMLASVALGNLLQDNFIERVPGAKKHYRVTQDTLANYF